ncbi:hypothetical protein RhiirA4_417444 [Rhizophagus irregularis]|uniref:Uncharacterized protein n=1 Tax=Rhizophagus irregularis TaxID=588596 RepID=A0A2I1G6Y9_9GLOM|nr:hypothetical protein RhiirA4_417444 [Rhizophagus irregularis]
MQHELVNLLKAFIYNVYNKNVQETQETQETETFTDINNPTITKHKRRLPKRLKSSIETSEKRVLKDSTNVNITENETRGRKCDTYMSGISDGRSYLKERKKKI